MATYNKTYGKFRSNEPKQLIPTLPEQMRILTINTVSLKDVNDDQNDARIDSSVFVASYSWTGHGRRTILVPGCPPRWSPPVDLPRLQQDSGKYYRDKNASQHPEYPTEPGIRAIFTMNPSFDGQKVDLFACSNTLGSLRAFVQKQEKSFRFAVQKVGKTLFFTRKENDPDEVIDGVRGYGHTFPEAYTTWDADCTASQSDHRLISCDLGDLHCIIRTEADGYLPDKLGEEHPLHPSSIHTQGHIRSSDLASLSISNKNAATTHPSALTVHHAGHEIPQNAIFDVKTRSFGNPINMEEVYARCWANSIQNFILAQHTRGSFETITVNDVVSETAEWEAKNRGVIGKLIETIHTIDAVVETQTNRRAEVRRVGFGDLQVWSDKEGDGVLPEEILEQWLSQDSKEEDGVVGAGTSMPGEGTEAQLTDGGSEVSRIGARDEISEDGSCRYRPRLLGPRSLLQVRHVSSKVFMQIQRLDGPERNDRGRQSSMKT